MTNAQQILSLILLPPASDQVAKVGVALVTARTGAPPHGDDSSTPMDTETTVAAADGTDAEGAALGRAGAAAAEGGRDKGAERDAVRPASFKALVGKGHPEFSSARQQVSGHTNATRRLLPKPYPRHMLPGRCQLHVATSG